MKNVTARQFFDVWAEAARSVRTARSSATPNICAELLHDYMSVRHGPEVAEYAVAYFTRLLEDVKAPPPR